MLYIVATPIGNLEDITFRAVETLKNVSKIYCEDTRRTKIILGHYQINKPLESFHQHSRGKIDQIISELRRGLDVAYVTDAGTPAIQDPGGELVEAARAAGVVVVPIPGPSAVTALLSVSGIPSDRFRFAGYVPTKKGRETFVRKLLDDTDPVVFFETAPRLQKLFNQLIKLGGAERRLIVGRELTKQFEEIQRGKPAEIAEHFSAPKGEFVLVLEPVTPHN
jgi:16S rRNA (cytidine1402-2'-O)-methyltransferase